MKLDAAGEITSAVEVTQISQNGIRLLIGDQEMSLPSEEFPWFRTAPESAIRNVKLVSDQHLHWPDLDIDLAVDSIQHPEKVPLIAK